MLKFFDNIVFSPSIAPCTCRFNTHFGLMHLNRTDVSIDFIKYQVWMNASEFLKCQICHTCSNKLQQGEDENQYGQILFAEL